MINNQMKPMQKSKKHQEQISQKSMQESLNTPQEVALHQKCNELIYQYLQRMFSLIHLLAGLQNKKRALSDLLDGLKIVMIFININEIDNVSLFLDEKYNKYIEIFQEDCHLNAFMPRKDRYSMSQGAVDLIEEILKLSALYVKSKNKPELSQDAFKEIRKKISNFFNREKKDEIPFLQNIHPVLIRAVETIDKHRKTFVLDEVGVVKVNGLINQFKCQAEDVSLQKYQKDRQDLKNNYIIYFTVLKKFLTTLGDLHDKVNYFESREQGLNFLESIMLSARNYLLLNNIATINIVSKNWYINFFVNGKNRSNVLFGELHLKHISLSTSINFCLQMGKQQKSS